MVLGHFVHIFNFGYKVDITEGSLIVYADHHGIFDRRWLLKIRIQFERSDDLLNLLYGYTYINLSELDF